MARIKGFKYVPGLVLAGGVALIAATNGCSAAQQAAAAAGGCSGFPGNVGGLGLDATTTAFVQAGADLVNVTTTMETAVLNACIGIDTDLGVTDTWTAKAPASGNPPDDELKEACTQASTAISAILSGTEDGGLQASAECGLTISGGQCQVSASAQASCEGNCNVSASCNPGSISVTARCSPGDLSVQCSGTCNASATCEGTAQVAAQCQGSCSGSCGGECDAVPGSAPKIDCQGTCTGNCTGTCVASGGTSSQVNGAACQGQCNGQCDTKCTYQPGTAPSVHCAGSCNGTCTGDCKISASGGVSCGANVSCKGGCTGTATAPQCEGELSALPPSCNANANCQASCQGHAEATASCTPPSVSLQCAASASGQLQTLVTTIGKNMPAIIAAVQTQGPLALKAAGHVSTALTAEVSNIGNLSGQAIACAKAALTASASASVSVNVSVQASASVSGSAGGPSS